MSTNAKNRNSKNKKRSPQKEPEATAEAAPVDEKISPYRFYVKGERSRTDGAFFELLMTKAFLEPGKCADFDVLWPRATRALSGLNLFHLSNHTLAEVEAAIGSVGGEFSRRMGRRAREIVVWAEAFWHIRQIYGSFRQYVHSFEADGHEALIGDLSQRLDGLSTEFLLAFLRESGEKIPPLPQLEKVAATSQRSGKSRGGGGRQGRGQNGGGRRRSSRGGNQKKTGAAAKPEKPATGDDTKGESPKGNTRGQRGRRGFFRRRRSGRGNKRTNETQSAQPKTTSNP